MTPPNSAIVVGGGIIGLSTAYHLASAPSDRKPKVLVIERDRVDTRGSTQRSLGNLREIFGLATNARASQAMMEVLGDRESVLSTLDGRPHRHPKRQGNLFLADHQTFEQAQTGLDRLRGLGCQVEWIDSAKIADRYPPFTLAADVGPETIVGGTLGRRDGSVDPGDVVRAFKSGARKAGVEFVHAEVDAIERNGAQVAGVRLSSGETIPSSCVINCAGAWAGLLTAEIGVKLPIQPTVRTVYFASAPNVPTESLPSIFFPSGAYAIPELTTKSRTNSWNIGASFADDPTFENPQETDLRPRSQADFTERIWPVLATHIPSFDELRIESSWAGLYAVNTLDNNAIVGRWPELSGLWLANGHSGHGFQHGFAVGRYLSEMILGLPISTDLSALDPLRVIENRPLKEHAII